MTNVTVLHSEFQSFNVVKPESLTVCLKELKSMLSFCKETGSAATLSFAKVGDPVLMNLNFSGIIVAEFVLATVMDEGSSGQSVSRKFLLHLRFFSDFSNPSQRLPPGLEGPLMFLLPSALPLP